MNSVFHVLLMLTMTLHAWSQVPASEDSWIPPHSLQDMQKAPVALIPYPQKVEWTDESWKLSEEVIVAFEGKDDVVVSYAVRSLKEMLAGFSATVMKRAVRPGEGLPPNCVRLRSGDANRFRSEGYMLRIAGRGIEIEAKDPSGFYYAVQTLRQILLQTASAKRVPGCVVNDWPAFGLRGLMHDNGRNFQGIAMLKAQLDRLSWYKFNTFHWHLTDNPAWRSETRIYPQLNDPRNREAGRDPDSTYSFEDIRELIRYARERGITIIPEFDMPGHSKYFEPTFGFKMESEQGMLVLERLIDEFCSEIPVSDCPVIHLGSDEVRIPNPVDFIRRMTDRVIRNGRRVMVWNPGLPPAAGTIEQLWREDNTRGVRVSSNPFVDSYGGYLNNYDVYSLVQRYFFQQVCNRPEGDTAALGGIVCCWPDVRVDDKSKIPLHSALWPGALTYGEAVWCGRRVFVPSHVNDLPGKGTRAHDHFREFEGRLARHRDIFFKGWHFPYVRFGESEWTLRGPYRRLKTDSSIRAFPPESGAVNDTAPIRKITGGILQMSLRTDPKSLSVVPDETVYLEGYIHSNKRRKMHAVLGFEAAARSNRRSGGIPPKGKWDANGGSVFVNGRELPGPEWQKPGGYRYLTATWHLPPNEIPYTDEEFFWSRPPARVVLERGWNRILVRVPRAYRDQRWMFAFVPVRRDGQGKWVEDPSIVIKAAKD